MALQTDAIGLTTLILVLLPWLAVVMGLLFKKNDDKALGMFGAILGAGLVFCAMVDVVGGHCSFLGGGKLHSHPCGETIVARDVWREIRRVCAAGSGVFPRPF